MKNILGKSENLILYNKEGNRLYEFYFTPNRGSVEYTYNQNGNQLTFKDSNEYSWEKTFNVNGRELTFKDSDGLSWESTYDDNEKELTYKHSCGISRGFDIPVSCNHVGVIPEYTMEQLVEKLGNFKIKK